MSSVSGLAENSRRTFTHAAFPSNAARCRGVIRRLSIAEGSAPELHNNRIEPTCPAFAARCKAVRSVWSRKNIAMLSLLMALTNAAISPLTTACLVCMSSKWQLATGDLSSSKSSPSFWDLQRRLRSTLTSRCIQSPSATSKNINNNMPRLEMATSSGLENKEVSGPVVFSFELPTNSSRSFPFCPAFCTLNQPSSSILVFPIERAEFNSPTVRIRTSSVGSKSLGLEPNVFPGC
mmetsp:Transcript_14721/g.19634  ORF Transcript_14721/g.19634 Transcript_14721/m.19634 type:complete len:235 (-) Transcript_14721:17-721(-)